MKRTVLAVIVCTMLALPGAAAISAKASAALKRENWRFMITDKTLIRVGDKTGNLSDLKNGNPKGGISTPRQSAQGLG